MAQTTVAINLEAKTKGTESVKSLKTQIREAKEEAIKLAQKFGEFSPEATAAAQRVAQLKDEMEDFNTRVEALNPDKFAAIGTVVKGLAGGIQAAQGAMALFGNESEDVQKAMLKVQGAMAFADGVDQLMQMENTFGSMATKIKGSVVAAFTTLRGAMMAVGIGLLVAGVAALIANFDKVSEWISNSWFGKLAKGIGEAVTAVTDFLGVTSQAERDLEKMTAANKKGNEEIDRRIEVLTAMGGKESEIYKLKMQQYENELNVLRATLKTKGKLTEEEAKQFKDLKTQQQVATIEFNKQQKEAAQKRNDEEIKKGQELAKKNQELAEQRKQNQLEINATMLALDQSTLDAQIKAADAAFATKVTQMRKNGYTEKQIATLRDAELEKVRTAFYDKQKADDEKAAEVRKQKEKENFENTLQAIDTQFKIRMAKEGISDDLEIQRLEAQRTKIVELKGLESQELANIDIELAKKRKEIYDKDVENKKKAEEQKKAAEQATIKFAADGFAMIAELADAFAGKSEEQQRKAFEIKKKASMAQAVIETIQAAQSAYASQMAIATPDAPIRAAVAAGLALAAGIARVRKIEQTPFEAKGLDTGGNGGGGKTPPAPSFAPTAGGTLPDEQQFGGMGRVYVLEGDITKTQTRVRRLRNTSVV